MSESIIEHQMNHWSIKCPHCDRLEDFDHAQTARAWLNGHIQESHADELPEF